MRANQVLKENLSPSEKIDESNISEDGIGDNFICSKCF
jgi:hypothetical protein